MPKPALIIPVIAVAITSLCVASLAYPNDATSDNFCREIAIGYTDGDINGVIGVRPDQPFGGPPINSFSALGEDDFDQYNLRGRYDYRHHRFSFGYDRTRLDGNTTDLWQGRYPSNLATAPSNIFAAPIAIPAHSETDLDLYRFGYQYVLDTDIAGKRLQLAPGVEVAVVDVEFDLEVLPPVAMPSLNDPAIQPTFTGQIDGIFTGDVPAGVIAVETKLGSSYNQPALRFGGTAELWLSDRFSVAAEVYESIDTNDWAQVSSLMASLRFSALRNHRGEVLLELGVGQETLDYNEGRDVLRAEYRELVQGNLIVRF